MEDKAEQLLARAAQHERDEKTARLLKRIAKDNKKEDEKKTGDGKEQKKSDDKKSDDKKSDANKGADKKSDDKENGEMERCMCAEWGYDTC